MGQIGRRDVLLMAAVLCSSFGCQYMAEDNCAVSVPECWCKPFIGEEYIECGLGNITTIPTFKNLDKNSPYLWLEFPKTTLKILPDFSFANLKTRKLYLREMGIEEVKPYAFSHLEHTVEEILLDNNQLDAIPSFPLRNLKKLKRLGLGFNQITNISKTDFDDYGTTIEELILSYNQLRYIGDVFRALRSLKSLFLGGNPLLMVDNNAFAELGETLTLLNMNDCHLRYLPNNAIAQLHNLENLRMERNNFTLIPRHAFVNLAKLERLVLVSGEVQTIEFEAFVNLTSLKILWLHNNKIVGSITKSMFVGLHSVWYLKLSTNMITGVDDLFSSFSSLEVLDVAENDFACDCSLAWMQQRARTNRIVSSRSQVCARPPNFQRMGYHIGSFPVSYLRCPKPTSYPAPLKGSSPDPIHRHKQLPAITGLVATLCVLHHRRWLEY